MAHLVRLIEYAPEITLIFCLRHRCTKNQVLQVFGRIEQEFNGSETLQVSPPKLNFGGRSPWFASARSSSQNSTSLNSDEMHL